MNEQNWEERATAAEARAKELETKVTELSESLTSVERKRQIDMELVQAEAVDLEAARMLTEAAVAQMSAPDVIKAVADLKKRKPFLFRPRRTTSGMSAAVKDAGSELVEIADHARATGDRRALLQYLRSKRNG